MYSVEQKMLNEKTKEVNFSYLAAGGRTTNYSDTSKNLNISVTNTLGETIRISKDQKEWTLTKEQKKIKNYTCFKAVLRSNPNVTAWYTPEISVSHGPKLYNGLPGLILELNAKIDQWIVRKIKFKSKEAKKIKMPTEGELITAKEFAKRAKGAFGEF